MPHEDLGPRRELREASGVQVTLHGEHHVEIAYAAPPGALRIGADWTGTLRERLTGLGARHGLDLDQAGRTRPPRRRPPLHRARLPRGDARAGRDPAGRLRPGPLAALERRLRGLAADGRPGRARGPRARADRPVRPGRGGTAAPAPAVRSHPGGAPAPLLRADRLPGAAAGMGLRPLEEPRRLRAPGRRARGLPRVPLAPDPARRRRHRLALGDAVQHLGVQSPPVPGPRRDGRADARGRGANGGVDHAVGQPRVDRRPAPAGRGVRAPPPPSRLRTTRRAPPPATSCATPTATRSSRAGGWARGRRWTSRRRAADEWWRAQARGVLELGVEGIKADDGEGYYFPDEVRFADGRRGADAAWAYGGLYRRSMQRALDEVHPGRGVRVRAQRLDRPAGDRHAVGRRSGLGLLVAARARGRHAERGGQRLLELVARRRRLPRRARDRALPPRAAHALGAVRLLHAAHAGARSLRAGAVDLRPRDARRLPRLRAAPRAAGALRARRRRHRRALRPADRAPAAAGRSRRRPRLDDRRRLRLRARRCGSRRCSRRARANARCRCRAATWIDAVSGERLRGGGSVRATAPAHQVPVYVRDGSIVVTYPEDDVASGLGDREEAERPLEATLWGRPASGRTGVRLADGTRVRWRAGEWSVSRRREVRFAER